jgi:fatty acid desaturase
MAKLTRAQREWRPGMPKKQRSTRALFASTVLALEAFVVLFAGLGLFGLHGKNPLYLVVTVVLAALFIGTCAIVTRKAGPTVGWVLQLLLIAGGFWEPLMIFVGVLFAIAWWYALNAGGRIDRENRARARQQAAWDAEHPEPGTVD